MIGVCFEVDIVRAAETDVGRCTNVNRIQDERSRVQWGLDEMLKLLVSIPDICRDISPADNCGCVV